MSDHGSAGKAAPTPQDSSDKSEVSSQNTAPESQGLTQAVTQRPNLGRNAEARSNAQQKSVAVGDAAASAKDAKRVALTQAGKDAIDKSVKIAQAAASDAKKNVSEASTQNADRELRIYRARNALPKEVDNSQFFDKVQSARERGKEKRGDEKSGPVANSGRPELGSRRQSSDKREEQRERSDTRVAQSAQDKGLKPSDHRAEQSKAQQHDQPNARDGDNSKKSRETNTRQQHEKLPSSTTERVEQKGVADTETDNRSATTPLYPAYTPFRKLWERLKKSEERGDVYTYEQQPISVWFSSDRGKFASRVAHALQEYVQYRSDDGKHARGLVLASSSLSAVWDTYKELGHQEDAPMKIVAILKRRADPIPENRWVMEIEFDTSHSDKDFVPETVVVDVLETIRNFFDVATVSAEKIPGDRGKYIQAFLELAQKQGPEKMLELWYYDPRTIDAFFSVRYTHKEQEEMIKANGGWPMKGTLPGNWQSGAPNWRIFPFTEILQDFSRLQSENKASEQNVRASLLRRFEGISKQLPQKSVINPMGSKAAQDKVFGTYVEHLKRLLKEDDQHLLYHWNEHVKVKTPWVQGF